MCGIAGEVVSSEHPGYALSARAARVEQMVASMKWRGPDDSGFYSDESAALGMCRLAIIDVEGGQQPISTSDGRYQIVYNGECYGTGELRGELEAAGHRFKTHSDTEVVLRAFLEWGPAGLERLNGMFALAIWDRQERKLFMARDRLGIKPLFYWQHEGRLVFSSTLGAIRAHEDFEEEIDPEAVDLFLATKFVAAPRTILKGVKKLLPGHFALWSENGLRIEQYWDLSQPQGPGPRSIDDAVDQLDELLRDAARVRLVSERPVGLCLSGGIDSGLLAVSLADQDIEAFSLGFLDPSFDESSVAATVAHDNGLAHHILRGEIDPDADFDDVIRQYDEPVGDSSGMALYNLSRLIAEHVTVVLSGTGGDELFGGYLRYVGSRFARWLHRLPGLEMVPRLLGRDESKTGWRKQVSGLASAARVPPLASLQRFISPLSPATLATIRRPELVRRLDGFRSSQVFEDHFDRASGSLLRRLMYTDLKLVLADDYLVKEDRMTMAHSIEGRVPFLDHRLAEFAFSLPDSMKISGLTTKVILRRLSKGRLPEKVVRGKKQGFEIPATAWLRGPLATRLRHTLLSSDAKTREFLQPPVVSALVEEHLGGRADHGRALWALLSLETWLRSSPARGA